MDSIKHNNSRRDFIRKTTLGATGLILLPSFLKASKGLVTAANEKVNLACIGIGNRGAEIIGEFAKTGLANIVALCDTDMGAPQTTKVMNLFPAAEKFQDFRKMFEKMGNAIDAVCIGVPDHSHFPITMHAMMLGKHVYVEKPLARTFQENELLMKAARKYDKVVTQMGNQGHSEANYFQFKTWVEAGVIKDVTRITAHMNSPRRWHSWDPAIKSFPSAETIPDTLDWDLWHSAVSKKHNYNKNFINGQWRCWYDFGMGALGDWGAHILDTAHQFLDLGLPEEVNCLKSTGHNNFFFPMSSTVEFKFPRRTDKPPVTITWYDGVDNLPPIPEGYGVSGLDPNIPPPSTGAIEPVKLNPGKIIYSKDLIFKGASHGSTLSIIPEQKAKEMQSQLPQVPLSPSNHYKNFLLACKGLEQTRSPFDIAGPLSQVFSLGVLAQQTNGKLKFDRKKKKITNNNFANALLDGPPPKKGWEQYYKV